MYLFIDATTDHGIVMKMTDGLRLMRTRIEQGDKKIAEKLLVVLDEFLNQEGVSLSQIKGMVVVTGPASFTTSRIVVTMANTLQQLAGVPVYGAPRPELDTDNKILEATKKVKRGSFLVPYYDKEPNITLPKAR